MSTMTDKNIVSLQTWWMGEVKSLTRKVMDQEEKRQARLRAKADKELGEYRTYNDVQDAYGCGVITARKRDRLYDLLEQFAPGEDPVYRMKLDMLAEMYQIAKQAVEDHSHE